MAQAYCRLKKFPNTEELKMVSLLAGPGRKAGVTLALACLLFLVGCSSSLQSTALVRQTPERFAAPAMVPDLPFYPQDDYQCGPAALATVLGASGKSVSPEALVPLVYVPVRRGSFQVEMVAAARSFGRLAYQIPPTLNALFAEINRGHPVLVLQNLGLSWYPRWHFAVVKGFDIPRRKVILNSGTIENYAMRLAVFERTWARSQHWAIVVLEPGIVPQSAEAPRYFNAVVAMEQNNAPELTGPAWRAGLERWPHDRELLMGYGNLLYSANRPVDAGNRFEAVIAHHPDYAPAYNNLAQIRLDQGRIWEAEIYATQAVVLGGIYQDVFRETLREIHARQFDQESWRH
jgi:tetratricopeptide (TPR) repeat protein